ncbi:MAG: hypothetical protein ACRDL8_08220 [Solirubrobacteraceae bacterium]
MKPLNGFDAMNLARALGHLESAQVSLEALQPPDRGTAKRFERARRDLADLLRDLEPLKARP